jgi:homopolymeric O-antigen transport system permease protein
MPRRSQSAVTASPVDIAEARAYCDTLPSGVGGLSDELPARRAATEAQGAVLVIEPPEARPRLDLRELWTYRGLIYFLVWRDLKVRYAQTVLGAGWAIVQPVLTMLIFTVIFGRFAGVPSDGVPYPVFSLAALVPWTYFATSFSSATLSLTNNPAMLTKVYFPRLVLPLATVITGLMDFAIAFVVAVLVMAGYRIVPSPLAIILVPVLLLMLTIMAAGVGSGLAAMAVQYRDIKHIAPFVIQIWMYASPIVYPMSIVPEQYRWLYMLNPIVGVVEGFRAVLLRTGPVPWGAIGVGMVVSLLLLACGVRYFRHTEHVFADVA